MKLSTAKDRMLRYLMEKKPGRTLEDFKMTKYERLAALEALAEEKYIEVIETSVSGAGNIKTLMYKRMLPKGAHFFESKQSFREQEIKKWITDFPKTYWILWVLSTLVAIYKNEFIRLLQSLAQ